MVPSGAVYGDVAVPSDMDELGKFQGLQRAINTYREKFGLLDFNRLATDGEVGNLTRSGANVVINHAKQQFGISVGAYGTNASLAADAQKVALALGAAGGFTPDFTPDPKGASPRVQAKVGTDVTSPMPAPSGKSKVGLAIAGGLLAGLVWWAASDRR